VKFFNNKALFTCNIYVFALIFATLNVILYHKPLADFIFANLNIATTDGILIFIEVFLVELLLSYVLIIVLSFIPYITKPLVILVFLGNSIAVYFVSSYNVILDKIMMGNVINTNFEEATDLYNYKVILYFIFLGIIPSLLIYKIKINKKTSIIKRIAFIILPIILVASFLYANSKTWLWLDKNLKILGALSMPFSYSINSLRYQIPKWTSDSKEYSLQAPDFINNNNITVVLVIGESARSANFYLYGYNKNTNPLLRANKNVIALPNATSCATYTTAGLGCILSHLGEKSNGLSKNYETLPTYLKKYGIKTIWRSANWGEPKIDVDLYQKKGDISKLCQGDCKNSEYDEFLLYGLEDLIKQNINHKTFIVLHQSGSHGPSYYNKYPQNFEKFTPVCKSVELKENCTQQDLINAYDNTILYTDYFLNSLINILQKFKGTPTVMLYISDHGESLGENNVYLHGLPNFMAPNFQRDIPFIVFMSDEFKKLYNIKNINTQQTYSHDNIFYSVMGALGLRSGFYKPNLDIFNVEK
jgi:lipid A ethanolaminephosphotransferase